MLSLVILSSLFLGVLVAISGAIVITASVRIKKAHIERDEALKIASDAQKKLESYGYKEITIDGD